MTPAELHQVMHRACWRKARYDRWPAMKVARAARGRGEDVSPYRCPFADDRHWHVGHVPSIDSVRQLAEAIRCYRQGTAA